MKILGSLSKMQVFESASFRTCVVKTFPSVWMPIEAGFEIWCDPRIRVGHEKTRII